MDPEFVKKKQSQSKERAFVWIYCKESRIISIFYQMKMIWMFDFIFSFLLYSVINVILNSPFRFYLYNVI